MMHFIKKWALVSWVSALATGVQAMPVEQGAEAAHSASCYELLLNVQPGFFASQLAQAYQQQLQTKGLEKGTIKHLTQEEFVQQIQADAASACVRLFIQPMASALRFSEALQDSVIVTVLGESSVALIGSTDLAAADAQEWLQQAAAQPNRFRFSSGGIGHGMHVATELLAQNQQVQLQHVVTKNSKEALQALLDGEADVTLTGFQEAQSLVAADKVKLLAVSGQVAVQQAPDALRFDQLDPVLNLTIPMVLYGVGLSDSQLQYWNAVFNQASVAPALLQQLAPRGFATLQLTQPQSQAYQDQYVTKYSPIYQRF